MHLKVPSALVSVDWLYENFSNPNLIILDATIPKIQGNSENTFKDTQIKNAVFFDLKNAFSDVNAPFPNTVPNASTFEKEAQGLGVNNDSCIVVYDNYGIYSSPRVWWLFQLMGFKNIAVLNGGLPEWIAKKYPTEKPRNNQLSTGNFKANYQPQKISFTGDVLKNIETEMSLVVDARSKGRFFATEPEPRKDMKGGHIPKSKSLPHTEIVIDNFMISDNNLRNIYNQLNPNQLPLIFSCGSGITASVLALGAEIAGVKNYSVYDGSWTEWASTPNLPIEK